MMHIDIAKYRNLCYNYIGVSKEKVLGFQRKSLESTQKNMARSRGYTPSPLEDQNFVILILLLLSCTLVDISYLQRTRRVTLGTLKRFSLTG